MQVIFRAALRQVFLPDKSDKSDAGLALCPEKSPEIFQKELEKTKIRAILE